MKKKVLDKIIDYIREEGPVMSMGNGGIAGSTEAGDDPPVKKRKSCLLYTSPSPRDVEESRMPSSA